MKYLSRIPAWLWSAVMVAAYFVPYASAVTVLLWYLSVFESIKFKAAEYYNTGRKRFYLLTTVNFLCSLVFTTNRLLFESNVSPLSDAAVAQLEMAVIFVVMFFWVWQIMLLANALSFALAGERFVNTRVKLLLAIVLAPIGVFYIMPMITEQDKD